MPDQENRIQYEATFGINLGKAVPVIGELMDSINADLSTMGVDHKMRLESPDFIPPMILTVDRELTQEEQRQVKTILESEVIQTFPKYDVRLTSFRRKSGNVSQSAVQ